MDLKALALSAAIIVAGFFLIAASDGRLFGPLWTYGPTVRFALFAVAGGLAVLLAAFFNYVRERS